MHGKLIRLLALLALLPGAALAQTTAAPDAEPAVFATIGDAVISRDEIDDLSQKLPASTGALEPLLPPLTESSAGARHTLTADEREALRALGYLGD